MKHRCSWPSEDPLMIHYHDTEWGVPLHDDRKLFEFMILDTFQAGLSWKTILHKRGNFRKAFDGFNPKKMVKYDEAKVTELLLDTGIIRNRLKIKGSLENARQFLKLQKEFGSFDAYIWQFSGGKPLVNKWKRSAQIPVTSSASDAMSADLRRRGFKFVGSDLLRVHAGGGDGERPPDGLLPAQRVL